jgi:transposase
MQRRKFSREFKVEAVKLVRERGVSAAQAGRDLGVHENVLRKWVKKFGSDPLQAFPGHGQIKPEQLEIERLRREVNKLKAERDILKKAAACRRGQQPPPIHPPRRAGTAAPPARAAGICDQDRALPLPKWSYGRRDRRDVLFRRPATDARSPRSPGSATRPIPPEA